MGNNTSTASERPQPVPSSGRTQSAAAGAPSGRERDQSATSTDGQKVAGARYLAPQSTPQSRIVVDIRSANLDKDYNVYIKQEPQRDVDIASVWSGLQALGGLFITVLTIQKLWEDIRFIRLLRRELSTLVGSLTDAGGGADANGGDGGGTSRPARPRGASGPSTAPSAPAARHWDLHLNELSDLLAGAGGRGAAAAAAAAGQAADEPTAAGAAAPTSASAVGEQQLQGSKAEGAKAAIIARKETTWASISGLMEVKILLQEATVLPTLRPDLFQGIRQPPKALLLFGPPGTGKTLLARAVATESRATFLPVTGDSVLSMWYGQSEQNVKALFEKARKRQPAIIFIDEVDSLLGKRSSGGRHDSTPDKRVTNEFLAFIDGIQTQQAGEGAAGEGAGAGAGGDARIVVIAATNTPWDLDEAALSRFSRRIYVPLPDKTTREALMRKALEGVSCDVSDADWQRLAERCDKYSGRDLVQVCREAAMRPLRELWGKRLLEGSPCPGAGDEAGPASQQRTAAAQQRLVDLVANSLAACGGGSGARPQQQQAASCRGAALPAGSSGGGGGGGGGGRADATRPGPGWAPWSRLRWRCRGGDRCTQSKKQARRELERWKRRHGASWCDVDAIMQQAERLVEIRRQAGQGQGPGSDEPAEGSSSSSSCPAQAQAASSGDAQGVAAPAEAAAAAEPGAGAAMDAAEPGAVRLRVRVRDEAAAAAAAGPEGPALEVSLEVTQAAQARGQGLDRTSAGGTCAAAEEGGPPPTSGPGRTEPAAAAAAAACGEDAVDGASAHRPDEGVAPLAGCGSGSAGTGAGSTAASAAESTAAPASAAEAGEAAGAAATGGAAASPSAGLGSEEDGVGRALTSMEKLLALPADRVRPVAVSDLEAALRVISCTEMDQSAKYTEWDEQYGSGASESGRHGGGSSRGRVWMSMYA
ncbi:hypothetical protein PLESTF_001756000 [Pleodorina starrii]|nr:hypothetical protein PLESTF_001756000 [Pleodorina starrii]